MEIITEKEMVKTVEDGIKNRSLYAIIQHENNSVNYGVDEKPNFECCKEKNITCYDVHRRGGAIYTQAGDVAVAYITTFIDTPFGERFTNDLVEYLVNKGLNAERVDNDILVDNYKVYGWGSNYIAEYNCVLVAIQISLSVDLDTIKEVCIKPMVKEPRGLNEWGITREDIMQFIYQFNEKYGY